MLCQTFSIAKFAPALIANGLLGLGAVPNAPVGGQSFAGSSFGSLPSFIVRLPAEEAGTEVAEGDVLLWRRIHVSG